MNNRKKRRNKPFHRVCINRGSCKNMIEIRRISENLRGISRRVACIRALEELGYESVVVDGTLLTARCGKCGSSFTISEQTLAHRLKTGEELCTVCNRVRTNVSYKENEIYDYLVSLGVNVERNNRTILDGLELDMYLPKYKLAIEFDGLYWHSDKYRRRNYHLLKTELAESRGIRLIHVFEDEWDYSRDIVKSRLAGLVGNLHRVKASACWVKRLTIQAMKKFLSENDSSVAKATCSYGLFDKSNNLVSVMSFIRYGRGGSYELVCHCDRLFTSVSDGGRTLFRYFLEHEHPASVVRYADRRWYTGDSERKLGFTLVSKTPASCSYIVHGRRVQSIAPLLTEKCDGRKKRQRRLAGILRIYDCGRLKYEYRSGYGKKRRNRGEK